MFQDKRLKWWTGNEGAILIGFDEQGRVQRQVFMEAESLPPESLAKRVQEWLWRVWP